MKGIPNLIAGALCLLLTTSAAYAAEPTSNEEFVGPFPSWANVKNDFGAIGNGSADDTAALQKALDTFPQKSNILYLPAGTYRITRGLTMTSHMFVGARAGNATTFPSTSASCQTTRARWSRP